MELTIPTSTLCAIFIVLATALTASFAIALMKLPERSKSQFNGIVFCGCLVLASGYGTIKLALKEPSQNMTLLDMGIMTIAATVCLMILAHGHRLWLRYYFKTEEVE